MKNIKRFSEYSSKINEVYGYFINAITIDFLPKLKNKYPEIVNHLLNDVSVSWYNNTNNTVTLAKSETDAETDVNLKRYLLDYGFDKDEVEDFMNDLHELSEEFSKKVKF